MSHSILALPHLILAIICLASYLMLAAVLFYQKVTGVKRRDLVNICAWVGLITVFLLVDTGFYMHRFDQVFTHVLHHPLALGALFSGGAASILAIIARKREALRSWSLYLAAAAAVLLILTSLFTHGQ